VAHPTDSQLARRLAADAGGLLVRLRDDRGDELSGAALKDAGDQAAQQFLAAELSAARPDDAILSEEAVDDKRRLDADRVWIIDPLDGTREFSEHRHDWAVHVALWDRRAGDLIAGAVALPGLDVTLSSADHMIMSTSSVHSRRSAHDQVRLAVSRTRAPQVAIAVADRLGAELVPMGSAGFKISAVIRGEVDAYVHAGGQYEWDSAAPVALARAAALHTSRLDGSPLRYNQPDPYLPDLVVCRPDLTDKILSVTSDPRNSTT
jgi:3'(2'), 5'-bisphosphate nucleotidase